VPQPSTRAKANGWDMVVESRVHQGRLHGGETAPGMPNFSWGVNPIREFEWMVWGMRAASRRLLERAVRGELPESKVAFDPSTHATDD
jgi:hypothetical protein